MRLRSVGLRLVLPLDHAKLPLEARRRVNSVISTLCLSRYDLAGMLTRMKSWVIENLGVSILLGLLAFSVYSHFQTGNQFSRLCERYLSFYEGVGSKLYSEPFDVTNVEAWLQAQEALRKKLDEVAQKVISDGYKALSQDERSLLSRQRNKKLLEIMEDTCSSRLADSDY